MKGPEQGGAANYWTKVRYETRLNACFLTPKLTNTQPQRIMNMNRNLLIQWAAVLCAACTFTTASAFAQQATDKLTEEEAHQLGIEAVVYGFPLVIVDLTKQVQTNVAEPKEDASG